MLNVDLLRFDKRVGKSNVWDVRYGASGEAIATLTEMVRSGRTPAITIQFYRARNNDSGPVVVSSREEAVRYIQKYYSGEMDREYDNED